MDSRTLDAIAAGLNKAASSPNIDIAPAAVPAVEAAVRAEVAKTETHLKNQEPWYQSRVMIGSIGTIVTSAIGIYGLVAAGIADGELYAAPIAAILGASFAIYGRIVARKPLGA